MIRIFEVSDVLYVKRGNRITRLNDRGHVHLVRKMLEREHRAGRVDLVTVQN